MNTDTNLANSIQYIEELDLLYIVDAMCAEKYPLPRWQRDEAIKCMQLYKNYLILQVKHPGTALVPTRQIDEFWHNHILYTKQYANDCEKIFGFYLHHEPAMPGDDDTNLANDYLHTKSLYRESFGEEMGLI